MLGEMFFLRGGDQEGSPHTDGKRKYHTSWKGDRDTIVQGMWRVVELNEGGREEGQQAFERSMGGQRNAIESK